MKRKIAYKIAYKYCQVFLIKSSDMFVGCTRKERDNVQKIYLLYPGYHFDFEAGLFYGGDPLFAHPPFVLGQRLGD